MISILHEHGHSVVELEEEAEAIISYKELMGVKDKLFQITDDEADLEFIDQLKEFRDSLNH